MFLSSFPNICWRNILFFHYSFLLWWRLVDHVVVCGAAILENSLDIPQTVKNMTILWFNNYTTWYSSKGYKNTGLKGYMLSNVYSSIINNNQTVWRAQSPSTDEWIKKKWYIYTMEYYSAIKKWNLAICNDVDATKGYMLSEISQSEKDNYHMISPCVEFKKQNRIIGEGREK